MPNLDEIATEAAVKWLRENCFCCTHADGTLIESDVVDLAAIIRAAIDQAAPGIRAGALRDAAHVAFRVAAGQRILGTGVRDRFRDGSHIHAAHVAENIGDQLGRLAAQAEKTQPTEEEAKDGQSDVRKRV